MFVVRHAFTGTKRQVIERWIGRDGQAWEWVPDRSEAAKLSLDEALKLQRRWGGTVEEV
jgi:hypothetical protein